jgi:hypothetical protein
MSEPKWHHIQVGLKDHLFGSTLFMDGKPVKGVRSIEIKATLNAPTTVIIEMIATVDCDIPEAKLDE